MAGCKEDSIDGVPESRGGVSVSMMFRCFLGGCERYL